MGEKEDLVEVAKKHLARSKRKLKAAKLLYEQRFFDDAISRAYYSAYHAVYALLILLGSSPRTHKGLINLFWIKVVEKNIVDKEIGRALSKLFSLRESADYSTIDFFSEADAQEAIKYATDIVSAIEKTIQKIVKTDTS